MTLFWKYLGLKDLTKPDNGLDRKIRETRDSDNSSKTQFPMPGDVCICACEYVFVCVCVSVLLDFFV